ncbi:MAG: hypothetical protein ACSHX0_08870 [Akkermansiaceae bacterium]
MITSTFIKKRYIEFCILLKISNPKMMNYKNLAINKMILMNQVYEDSMALHDKDKWMLITRLLEGLNVGLESDPSELEEIKNLLIKLNLNKLAD